MVTVFHVETSSMRNRLIEPFLTVGLLPKVSLIDLVGSRSVRAPHLRDGAFSRVELKTGGF
jgi:hypothetical protein